jgi:glycosyltransferase involved in cell wall biosynthesis
LNINITAPWNSLGYGVAASNIIKALLCNDVNVAYWPITTKTLQVALPQPEDEDNASLVRELLNNREFFDATAPSLRIWHQDDMAQHIGSGERIGFPIFELDRFTDVEKHNLRSLDRIFVCSQWAKNIIHDQINYGLQNKISVYVIPLGVDRNIFNENKPMVRADSTTIFMNVGKWEVRKGHDILCSAFNEAFKTNDNVELHMMCDNPFLNEYERLEWERHYLDSPLGKAGKIRILVRQPTHSNVADMMREADVGVFPSRAEGWNLELLEFMSMGKHVIATNCSAHTEFVNTSNTLLIPIEATELAYDGFWFNGQGNWGLIDSFSINELILHMRELHDMKQKGQLKVNQSGIETAKRFSWDNSAKKIIEYLHD